MGEGDIRRYIPERGMPNTGGINRAGKPVKGEGTFGRPTPRVKKDGYRYIAGSRRMQAESNIIRKKLLGQ